jgi:hypothetical protein
LKNWPEIKMTADKSNHSNRGGSRSGAGRKPGAINKATAKAREAAEAGGIMPLEFMLTIMRDPDAARAERLDMAKAAAPYVHAKLASIEHSGAVALSHEQALDALK